MAMTTSNVNPLEHINSLYLNENGADIWFRFDDERIPAHKIILTAMSKRYETAFFGSIRENGEVNMNVANVPNIMIDSFKEFLKFCYGVKPALTMDNIEGVIDMAKQSFSDKIFAACEDFLESSTPEDDIFFGYYLALRYESARLQKYYEGEICANAVFLLKSESFLKFPYEYFQLVLQCNSLACEEIDIFNACIRWAVAQCTQNGTDPINLENLRACLQESIYEIRFTSMTKKQAATCIRLYGGLFTADELQEIICMVGDDVGFHPKKFNWTPRYFNITWNRGFPLYCFRIAADVLRSIDRSRTLRTGTPSLQHTVKRTEITQFRCNRRILLKEICCEIDTRRSFPLRVIINETENDDQRRTERFNRVFQNAAFTTKRNVPFESYTLDIDLGRAILLRPNHTYEIQIIFEVNQFPIDMIHSYSYFIKHVRVDHDIVFKFLDRGIVCSLTFYRFDTKTFWQKVVYDPKLWFIVIIIFCLIGYFMWTHGQRIIKFFEGVILFLMHLFKKN